MAESMLTDRRAALAKIKRFDQLIAYLRDDMDWPIVSDDFEELTFEYTPYELGIDENTAAKIQEIKRLRPLAANQPWGVFFVKFEPKRLPVVALRSILGRVALKKRASANDAERPAWAMEDLLFISNYGEGDARQISFAHFAVPSGTSNLSTLKVLGWDDRDTALHLDTVARDLTENLAWPGDEDDIEAWRERWRAAFTLRHREVITTSQDLSIRLAELARAIRHRIVAALEIETENGRVTKLMEAFREALLHELDRDGFADMIAQTITYGLLSARIADPGKKTADDFASHMRTNPLLRELLATFLQVSGQHDAAEIDFDELGVAEVVELLDDANMEAVVRDFGDRNPREDPVIHFYESFLTEYDKEKKVERGVFYTPRPVVSYIVRSVHALLRSEFGLEDGLADTTTWGEMAQRGQDLTIPEGVSADQDFVQILDPATGTGTFLVEVIDLIYRTLVEKWQVQGHGETGVASLWNEYVPKHLLPRLHGYELLMAPYAIAHLKIGLKLYETGYRFGSNERARVYLTNALESAQDFLQGSFDFAIPALADEAQAVNEVKRTQRFTVVIGNPPYSGDSANKGDWIRDLLRGSVDDLHVENYFEVDGGSLNERNPKWLNNDYVKFIRLAHWQIERAGRGVIGFITSNSYLDSPTFRGMRESLAATFPRVHLLDLHGNANKKDRAPDGGKDENVFDIKEGVAIGLFVRPARNALHQCSQADLWGERETTGGAGKYDRLVAADAERTEWQLLSPRPPLHLFVPRDEVLRDEYDEGWSLTNVFPVNSTGIVSKRDKIAFHFEKPDLYSVLDDFSTLHESALREKYAFRDSRDGKISFVKEHILSYGVKREYIRPCLYRPFDYRWTYYTDKSKGFLGWPVYEVMRHMLAGDNLGLSTTRSTEIAEGWEHIFASRHLIQHHTVSLKEVNYLFPLYTFPPETQSNAVDPREPNLDIRFTQDIGSAIGLKFKNDGPGDLDFTFGPEDVFHYIYAVLHSPEYRRRYADFLKSDFPRVPLPGNRDLFADIIRPGARLVSLHLMEADDTDARTTFPVSGGNNVDKVRYGPRDGRLPGRVWINSDQYFDGVDPDTFAFAIGGYRPAEKWLKDRKGRTLSEDDIAHYRKIIAALAETKRLMAEIDDIIEAHGGWPAAFEADKAKPATAEIVPFRPRIVEPEQADRYVTCAPLIPLQAAAGAFGDPQTIDETDDFEWAAIDTRHRLRPGMFVAQIVGKSMEPAIPDGAWCLFRAPVEGTREGKTVLVQLRHASDPDTGQRYTVKRYASQKAQADGSWRHTRITLKPNNPAFEPIVLTGEDEGELQVVAELIEVLGENHR